MKLLAKFGVIALMLALTLFVSVGVPTWAGSVADMEVQAAQVNLMQFVESLNQIRDDLDREADQLSLGSRSKKDRERVASLSAKISKTLGDIESSSRFRRYAGVGITPVFTQRVRAARDRLDDVIEADQSAPEFSENLASIMGQLSQLQDVFDLVEERLLGELQLTIAHSHEIQAMTRRIFIVSLGLSVLVGALAMLLLRRWVIRPVLELRVAAGEIASGNFSYRISSCANDELGVLSKEINQMAGTIAEMQNRAVARERFATMEEMARRLAHNLRNPLGGIRSLAESARLDPNLDARIAEDLDLIISTIDRFEEWLAKLLHSASTLEIHSREDSPAEMLVSVFEAHQLMAKARSIDLQVDVAHVPSRAVFDRMHLEQALVALTTNAIEATPAGGRVLLSGDQQSESGQWVVLVEDSGPGIRREDRVEVFRPYFTTKPEGTGLGLALADNVAHAHGGRVEVGDSDLGGARFAICLSNVQTGTMNGGGHGQRRSG